MPWMQHQLQPPPLGMSWPCHSQQTAPGGPHHIGVGDTDGPTQVQKGLCQPTLADEETGEPRVRGSATPTISAPHHNPTDSQKLSTLVGKRRPAPPTLSVPHPGPTGSSKVPTTMDKRSITTPTTSLPCHGPTSRWKEHAAMEKWTSKTPIVSVTHPHPTDSQKLSTLVGKGRSLTVSVPHPGPTGSSKVPTAVENGSTATPTISVSFHHPTDMVLQEAGRNMQLWRRGPL